MVDSDPERQRAGLDLIAWLVLAYRPVSAAALAELGRVDLTGILRTYAGPEAGSTIEETAGTDPETLARELESEYVRLFVNSREAPLAHLEALAWLPEEGDARGEYLDRLGHHLADRGLSASGRGLPVDHLTVLLEVLYAEQGIAEAAAASRHPFTQEYLSPWVDRFLDRLESLDPSPLYRNAAIALRTLLHPRATNRPITESDHERAERHTIDGS